MMFCFTGNECVVEPDSSDAYRVLTLIEQRQKLVEALDAAEMRFALDEASRDAYVDEYGYQPDKGWYGDWELLKTRVERARTDLEIFDRDFPWVKSW